MKQRLLIGCLTLVALGALVAVGWSPCSLCSSVLAAEPAAAADADACRVLADQRLEDPLRTIAAEFFRRGGVAVEFDFRSPDELHQKVQKRDFDADVVLGMTLGDLKPKPDGAPPEETKPAPRPESIVSQLDGAKKVAWKHPGGWPVWAAVVGKHASAAEFMQFVGGPTGHRLWSESPAGFTITSGKTHAEAFDWVVENRVKHTYPLTATRMLAEVGGIREGLCIDIGCGTGNLDVELAKRSKFSIIGLDIDGDMQPLFEKRAREAGLTDRLSFVEGDAQELPFPDDHADIIVSRGTLTFIPDIAKCLREVDRVLKPTGVAFLGGRYLYTPYAYKKTTDELRKIVADSGVPGAQVIDARGQWVKIIGPEAPEAAHRSGMGPGMLAGRLLVDYRVTEGRVLVVCASDGGLQQAMQRGFVDLPDLEVVAMYPTEKMAEEARRRIAEAKLDDRITCKVGTLEALPFDDDSINLIAGVGPVLIWGDRQKKMQEIYRVLRRGGAAMIGGKYLGMPAFRKVSSDTLRKDAAAVGIRSIRISDDMGQWVEVRK